MKEIQMDPIHKLDPPLSLRRDCIGLIPRTHSTNSVRKGPGESSGITVSRPSSGRSGGSGGGFEGTEDDGGDGTSGGGVGGGSLTRTGASPTEGDGTTTGAGTSGRGKGTGHRTTGNSAGTGVRPVAPGGSHGGGVGRPGKGSGVGAAGGGSTTNRDGLTFDGSTDGNSKTLGSGGGSPSGSDWDAGSTGFGTGLQEPDDYGRQTDLATGSSPRRRLDTEFDGLGLA